MDRSCVQALVERPTDTKLIATRMVDISVQLFSNFNLTLQMMKEEKLLETLFNTMSILCAHALTARDVQNQSALVLDMRHVIISQRMYRPAPLTSAPGLGSPLPHLHRD
jgi:hypothetical protein